MAISTLILIVGLVLVLAGARFLVDGASSLARAFGISDLVIGLTVVAFGTSAPELAVNLSASLSGKGDIAFGNVVGSNICNVGLILGISALIRPLTSQNIVIRREIPMMLLASAAMLTVSLDKVLNDASFRTIGRSDGITLLLLFCVFLYYLIMETIDQRGKIAAESLESYGDNPPRRSPRWLLKSLGFTLGGLVGLLVGGQLTVNAAVDLAEAAGVPEVVVGLFLLAVGTSLPELAVSATAAFKGKTDIAIGNVVGSNIFNILFVIGVSATIKPLDVPPGGMIDLIVMIVFAAGLLPIAATHGGRIIRAEGALLLAAYIGYSVWRGVSG